MIKLLLLFSFVTYIARAAGELIAKVAIPFSKERWKLVGVRNTLVQTEKMSAIGVKSGARTGRSDVKIRSTRNGRRASEDRTRREETKRQRAQRRAAQRSDLNRCHGKAAETTDLSKRAALWKREREKTGRRDEREGSRVERKKRRAGEVARRRICILIRNLAESFPCPISLRRSLRISRLASSPVFERIRNVFRFSLSLFLASCSLFLPHYPGLAYPAGRTATRDGKLYPRGRCQLRCGAPKENAEKRDIEVLHARDRT